MTQTYVKFAVFGTPAPQGSKRHVGNGIMVESSTLVKPWREAVKYAAIEAREQWPQTRFAGPVRVRLWFWLRRPQSAPKRVLWPTTRPDLDKLIRSTLDGIGEAGVWVDDAQVVNLSAYKQFATDRPPGADIVIESIDA